jgi:hypothetical protein
MGGGVGMADLTVHDSHEPRPIIMGEEMECGVCLACTCHDPEALSATCAGALPERTERSHGG